MAAREYILAWRLADRLVRAAHRGQGEGYQAVAALLLGTARRFTHCRFLTNYSGGEAHVVVDTDAVRHAIREARQNGRLVCFFQSYLFGPWLSCATVQRNLRIPHIVYDCATHSFTLYRFSNKLRRLAATDEFDAQHPEVAKSRHKLVVETGVRAFDETVRRRVMHSRLVPELRTRMWRHIRATLDVMREGARFTQPPWPSVEYLLADARLGRFFDAIEVLVGFRRFQTPTGELRSFAYGKDYLETASELYHVLASYETSQHRSWASAVSRVTPVEPPGARDGGPRRGERSERRGKET